MRMEVVVDADAEASKVPLVPGNIRLTFKLIHNGQFFPCDVKDLLVDASSADLQFSSVPVHRRWIGRPLSRGDKDEDRSVSQRLSEQGCI